MEILVLGGTGAMGVPLVREIEKNNWQVVVTSRSEHEDSEYVHYVRGNAKELQFLDSLLFRHYDVIVDFMNYSTAEFKERFEKLLNACSQYIFLSSARVYSEVKNGKISEATPRLLDILEDADYLKTDEYALAKARQEDILKGSGYHNWTIIRPSITYNAYRLQLGGYEKEDWLYRVMNGHTVVFSKDMLLKKTTMTGGKDVARAIIGVMQKKEALCSAYTAASPVPCLWQDVLNTYVEALHNNGYEMKVVMEEESLLLQIPEQHYRMQYSKLYSREFDVSHIGQCVDTNSFEKTETGLARCIDEFMKNPSFATIDWKIQGLQDRITKEKTPMKEIPIRFRYEYLAYRYNMKFLLERKDDYLTYLRIQKFFRRVKRKLSAIKHKIFAK